jgi:hypothetical protein
VTGDSPAAGKTIKVRSMILFRNDNYFITIKWEKSSDGLEWEFFGDINATKVR